LFVFILEREEGYARNPAAYATGTTAAPATTAAIHNTRKSVLKGK
jgi:hypothetical protein